MSRCRVSLQTSSISLERKNRTTIICKSKNLDVSIEKKKKDHSSALRFECGFLIKRSGWNIQTGQTWEMEKMCSAVRLDEGRGSGGGS